MKSVAEQFEDWWASVRPAGGTVLEEQDAKRAFYAGFGAMFFTCIEMSDDKVTDDDAGKYLEVVDADLDLFTTAIRGKNLGRC